MTPLAALLPLSRAISKSSQGAFSNPFLFRSLPVSLPESDLYNLWEWYLLILRSL
jgi:hypothetical protein